LPGLPPKPSVGSIESGFQGFWRTPHPSKSVGIAESPDILLVAITMTIRPAAVAGMFYPGDYTQLVRELRVMLSRY